MSLTPSLGRRLVAPRRVVALREDGFTLIELLIVITIIAVLAGFLFPAFQGVQERARKVQAKNDLVQIVGALNAFYTEYGQYPCNVQPGDDAADYYTANDTDRKKLFDNLRAPFPTAPPEFNPKNIAFLQPPVAKDDTAGNRKSGVGSDGVFYDPWGFPYRVKMDNNYNGLLANPYTSGAGFGSINSGVIALSAGKDGKAPDNGGDKNLKKTDDVISWQ
jgi:prepilin-type N-terminal cleavage/methylation domain-containing protein